jgi:hypothetical protein
VNFKCPVPRVTCNSLVCFHCQSPLWLLSNRELDSVLVASDYHFQLSSIVVSMQRCNFHIFVVVHKLAYNTNFRKL